MGGDHYDGSLWPARTAGLEVTSQSPGWVGPEGRAAQRLQSTAACWCAGNGGCSCLPQAHIHSFRLCCLGQDQRSGKERRHYRRGVCAPTAGQGAGRRRWSPWRSWVQSAWNNAGAQHRAGSAVLTIPQRLPPHPERAAAALSPAPARGKNACENESVRVSVGPTPGRTCVRCCSTALRLVAKCRSSAHGTAESVAPTKLA